MFCRIHFESSKVSSPTHDPTLIGCIGVSLLLHAPHQSEHGHTRQPLGAQQRSPTAPELNRRQAVKRRSRGHSAGDPCGWCRQLLPLLAVPPATVADLAGLFSGVPPEPSRCPPCPAPPHLQRNFLLAEPHPLPPPTLEPVSCSWTESSPLAALHHAGHSLTVQPHPQAMPARGSPRRLGGFCRHNLAASLSNCSLKLKLFAEPAVLLELRRPSRKVRRYQGCQGTFAPIFLPRGPFVVAAADAVAEINHSRRRSLARDSCIGIADSARRATTLSA